MRRLMSSIWTALGKLEAAALGPHRTATSFRRGPVLWLILCGVVLVAAIIVGTVVMVSQFRERALSNSERELENTVLLLTRHFDQQMEDAEATTVNLIGQLELSKIASPEIFRQRMSGFEAHQALKSKVSVLSYIDHVNIFDAAGDLVNSSGNWPLAPIHVRDREYFKIFKANPPSATFRAEALRSYDTGRWTTVIAHRLAGQNGVFLGVMTRRIVPDYYEKFFASLALGDSAAISLFHRDGTLLARYPHAESMVGQNFKTAPLLQRVLAHGGRQTLRVQSPVDDMDRLGSAAALSQIGRAHV